MSHSISHNRLGGAPAVSTFADTASEASQQTSNASSSSTLKSSRERFFNHENLPTRVKTSAPITQRSVKVINTNRSSTPHNAPTSTADQVLKLASDLRGKISTLPANEADRHEKFVSNTLALCNVPALQLTLLNRLAASIPK